MSKEPFEFETKKTTNYEKIKNMAIEEIPEMLSVELNTKTEDGHITRHWYLGLNNEIYPTREKMIEGVIDWLKQEATDE